MEFMPNTGAPSIGVFLIAALVLALPFILGPLRRGAYHVVVSIILLFIYGFLFTVIREFRFYQMGSYLMLEMTYAIIILGTIFSTLICYFRDLSKPELDSEEFYDERLFYKYGQEIKSDIIPMGIQKPGENENTADIIEKLSERLSIEIAKRFDDEPRFYNQNLKVKDAALRDDSRYFAKFSFDTIRKSTLTYFINIKKMGEQIVVTNFQYVRSRHYWYNALLLIMTAPFHYWFWIYHWVRNKYSIRSILGTYYYGNSFDLIDLEGYLKVSNFIILNSIQDFAQEYDLLTEELKQLIVNNITNTQNIQIEKSRGVRVGKLKIASSK